MIRPARGDDAERAAIWRLAQAFATSYVPERSAFEKSFSAVIAEPNVRLSIAEVDDSVVGYVLANCHKTFFANGPVCWVEELMVSTSFRRAGIGSELIGDIEEWARQQGAVFVSLATRRAAEFYRSLNYQESASYFKKSLA